MPATLSIVAQMFLPLGRCGRRGLLLAALVMLAGHVVFLLLVTAGVLGFYGSGSLTFKLAALWISAAMASKRLHDIGYSAWWLLGGMAGLAVWSVLVSLIFYPIAGLEVLVPGSGWYWLAFGIVALPLLVATAWLHTARGTPGDNRYGPLPDGFGMSLPVRRAVSPDNAAAV